LNLSYTDNGESPDRRVRPPHPRRSTGRPRTLQCRFFFAAVRV